MEISKLNNVFKKRKEKKKENKKKKRKREKENKRERTERNGSKTCDAKGRSGKQSQQG